MSADGTRDSAENRMAKDSGLDAGRMTTRAVRVGAGARAAHMGGGGGLALIAGPCVIEEEPLALEVAFLHVFRF